MVSYAFAALDFFPGERRSAECMGSCATTV